MPDHRVQAGSAAPLGCSLSDMTDMPRLRLSHLGYVRGRADRIRSACPPRHAAARSDDDSAGRATRPSRPGRRRSGVEMHRAGAASADRRERAELGVHRREGPPRQGEARQALPPGVEGLLPQWSFGAPQRATSRWRRPRVQFSGRSTTSPRSRSSWWPACASAPATGACRSCACRMPPSRDTMDRSIPACRTCCSRRAPWGWVRPSSHLPLWSVASARRILKLPLNVTPCCIVPLGWPRGGYGPTTRDRSTR